MEILETFSARTLKIDGKTVRYYTNRRRNGKPIVILHGFMSDATSLVPFAEALKTDRPVIIPDLPGFGESDGPDDNQGLRWYVDWLKQFMEALDINTPGDLIGYSFGAYIAVLYSCLFPKMAADTLILLTPVVKISWQVRIYGRGFRFIAIRSKRLAERTYLMQHDMTTRYLWKNRHPGVRTQLMERRRSELEYLNPELVLRLFSEFLEINLLEYAKKIKMPVLIVMASNDNVAAPSATRIFASQVKSRATIIDIQHAGHLLPIEEARILAASLKNHLQ